MAEYSQKWHNGTSRGRSTETSDGLVDLSNANDPYTKGFAHKKKRCKAPRRSNYMQIGVRFSSWGYRATAPGYYQRNNANPSIQNEGHYGRYP
ncbi:hypothetical protein Tco_0505231 [Tanacetum coccineum]